MDTYKHILVAIDVDLSSQLVLQRAVRLAKAFEAELSVVHVGDELADLSEPHPKFQPVFWYDYHGLLTQMNKEVLEHFDHSLENIDYPLKERLVKFGSISDEVSTLVEEKGYDLVVCGHHHSFWHNLSSGAARLMGKCNCDMMIVPLFD
ncbi:universal stress protein [Ferrimonas marina]|uniref:Universal stress protein n=1 Tax=Ferrimonas marina TaxID=299255 RepID=A0A1M5XCM5_9GAMM|nr:universal stress protein [Ferrimonas marina]SHH97607.1 universal stress protein A [Ferrimonas marina]